MICCLGRWDSSEGEVQNKFCYILQNKNQKNYWGATGPHGRPPVDTPLNNKVIIPKFFLSKVQWWFLKVFSSFTPLTFHFLSVQITLIVWVFCAKTFERKISLRHGRLISLFLLLIVLWSMLEAFFHNGFNLKFLNFDGQYWQLRQYPQKFAASEVFKN